MTSLLNAKKPTPFEEAKNIIYYLRTVYYDAAAKLYLNIKEAVDRPDYHNPGIVQLGFWPGGDRDGNPFVTARITNEVADELRMTLMKCYYNDTKELEQKLSFKEVDEVLAALRNRLYTCMFDPAKTISYEEIISPLNKTRETIIEKYNSLYLDQLENLIDKVNIFKTHFAILDLRQHHEVHKKAVEAILIKENIINNSLDELDEEELISILLHKKFFPHADQFEDALVQDTIANISQISHIQSKNGETGCHRYIISNAEDIYSVLFVYGLLRWCFKDKEIIPVDIVPLFESMEGMKNSASIMKALFDIPEYRRHLEQRKNIQTVMLGFSDGTKDGGYLQANWSIFKTKENLSAVCRQYDVKAMFFDGRGGPPARGGGKSHRFYASQSHRIANHGIQLTIQGQTITSRYSTEEQFIDNLEQLLTAGLSHYVFEKENDISEAHRQLIEDLASLSFEKYTALKNHDMFIPYLENKSTLKYYSEANIGSRPARRANKEKLELTDLRAIPFVGSWSQSKQNVPGYFGIGTALQSLVDAGKLEELKELFTDVPFFKALILNSMMSLSKCNFNLTRYMAKDEAYGEFWNILHDEYRLSKEMVLLISGYNVLMEEEILTKSSLDIREHIVLPLLVIQQYALQKIEHSTGSIESYEKIVKRSLYGNINASRNSV
jgi:phosphoenolpyruvate carboxylase